MRICTLASSSSGNCTIVSHGGIHILIDTGISLRRIKEGLRGFELSPDDLCGVLITHEHIDHIRGIKMLVKYHKTPVFTSYGTGCGIIAAHPEAEPFLNIFETGSDLDFGGMAVRSFSTPHDASGSVGFTLHANGKKLVYVTDLGFVTGEVAEAALGADVAVIEANHDKEMLRRGPYPQYLKRRILSERGHLANSDSGDFAVRLADSGLRYILLAHLSRENNTPEIARSTVGAALSAAGFAVGRDIELDVAPPDTPGRIYDL